MSGRLIYSPDACDGGAVGLYFSSACPRAKITPATLAVCCAPSPTPAGCSCKAFPTPSAPSSSSEPSLDGFCSASCPLSSPCCFTCVSYRGWWHWFGTEDTRFRAALALSARILAETLHQSSFPRGRQAYGDNAFNNASITHLSSSLDIYLFSLLSLKRHPCLPAWCWNRRAPARL